MITTEKRCVCGATDSDIVYRGRIWGILKRFFGKSSIGAEIWLECTKCGSTFSLYHMEGNI